MCFKNESCLKQHKNNVQNSTQKYDKIILNNMLTLVYPAAKLKIFVVCVT